MKGRLVIWQGNLNRHSNLGHLNENTNYIYCSWKKKTNRQKTMQSKIVIYIFCFKTSEFKKNKMFMKYVYQWQTALQDILIALLHD